MAPRASLRSRPRGATVAVALTGFALCITACSSSPSGRAADAAAPLLQASASAFSQVATVRTSGTVLQKSGSTTVSISVDATSAGPPGTSEGTLDLEGPGLGFTGTTRFIVVDGLTYVNAGKPFWMSLFGTQTTVAVNLESEILPLVLNRWVELTAASTDVIYKETLGLSEPKVFVAGSLTGAKGTLTNAGNQTLNGQSGVEISSTTGAKILVASSGPALPLAITDVQSSAGGFGLNLAVSYPTGVTIAVPAHVVSLAGIEAALSK